MDRPEAHLRQPPPGPTPGWRRLERLRAQAQEGRRPDPSEFRDALRAARDHARTLARSLAHGQGGQAAVPESQPGEQAGLTAYEQALALCRDLTLLGLELTRRHGPDFLPAPDERP